VFFWFVAGIDFGFHSCFHSSLPNSSLKKENEQKQIQVKSWLRKKKSRFEDCE